jgi:protocatechuate 3,4-dioxygenase beta subunit
MFELCVRWFAWEFDTSLKAALVALVAAGVLKLLRFQDSNIRHRVWTGVLAGMFLLPVLTPLMPALRLPLVPSPEWLVAWTAEPAALEAALQPEPEQPLPFSPPAPVETVAIAEPQPSQSPRPLDDRWQFPPGHFSPPESFPSAGNSLADRPALEIAPVAELPAPAPLPPPPAPRPGPSRRALAATFVLLAGGLWLCVSSFLLLRLAIGLWLAARLRRESLAIDAADLAPANAFATVRESPVIRVPLTVGCFAPQILLPPQWRNWPTDKLHAVLAHEQMHVQRGDCAVALLAQFNCCLYWFHPLAWWLKQHLAALAEQACDDAAIDSIGDRAQYARHLLEVAAAVSKQHGRFAPAGVSMARRSNVEQRIHAILDFTRPLSQRLTLTRAALLVALMLPLIALAAALQPASGGRDEARDNATSATNAEGPASGESQPMGAAAADPSRSPAADNSDTDPTFIYAGSVVNSKDQPVRGAEVRLLFWQKEPPLENGPPLATTDAEGKFRFQRRKSDFREGDGVGNYQYASLVVTQDGFGLGIAPSTHFESTGGLESELNEQERQYLGRAKDGSGDVIKLLADDLPIEGRIVNLEGQPVAGALVEVTGISEGQNGSLDAWFANAKKPGSDYYSADAHLTSIFGGGSNIRAPREEFVFSTTTDDSGRFTLRGLGRERMADLFVSGPGIETAMLRVCSRAGEIVKLPMSARNPYEGQAIFYPSEFTHVVGPSQAVAGRVTDKKTGQPLAGLLVKAESIAPNDIGGSLEAGYIRTLTNADGRYRLTGLPLGDNTIMVVPPEKSRYLIAGFEITTKTDNQPLSRDVELTQGIVVRGRVTDRRTGQPLSGKVEYFAFNNNPHLREARGFAAASQNMYYRAEEDGQYAIPVLPGRGILTFMADQHEHYQRGAGADEIDGPKTTAGASHFQTSPHYVLPSNFHLLKRLDLAPEIEELKLDLSLTSGVSFTSRLRAADGQPLSGYHVFGDRQFGGWYEDHKGESFEVRGYLADEGRRVMVYHPARNLVGLVDVTGPAPQEIDIELRPGGTIRGRVVDSDGSPLEGLALYAKVYDFFTAKGRQSPAELQTRGEFPTMIDGLPIRTDQDGRFELPGLIPGHKYTAGVTGTDTMNGRQYTAERGLIFTDVTVESGQTKDLGDLSPKRQERKDPAEKESPKAAEPKAAEAPAAAADDTTFIYAGSVVDPSGKPVAGAKLHLCFESRHPETQRVPLATTDASGKFQFSQRRRDLDQQAKEPTAWEGASLAVTAEGYGFASGMAAIFETTGRLSAELPGGWRKDLEEFRGPQTNVLKLVPDDVPIRGRIVSIDGQPVAGASLEILDAWEGEDGNLDGFEKLAAEPNTNSYQAEQSLQQLANEPHEILVTQTKTDREGWLSIKGLGRDRVVKAQLHGPGIESTIFYVRSKNGKALQLPRDARDPDNGFETFHPAEFTHVAAAAQPIVGRVTDATSGKPIPGCTIQGNLFSPPKGGPSYFNFGHVTTTTDADGRFRLEGMTPNETLPRGFSDLLVLPPRGSAFLPGAAPVKTTAAPDPATQDVALESGIRVHGKVVDGRTGKPVYGSLSYFAADDNTAFKSAVSFKQARVDMHHYQSDVEGLFEIPVLPGQGILAFTAGNWPEYPRGVGLDDAKRISKGIAFKAQSANLLMLIDLPAGPSDQNVMLTLGSGATHHGRVFTPDGKPIDKFVYSGATSVSSWQTSRGPTFEVLGYFPALGRRLIFCDPQRNLVALHQLTGEPPADLKITLRPGAKIKGRVLDQDGQPLENLAIITPGQTVSSPADYKHVEDPARGLLLNHAEARPVVTDQDGRFELPAIIPGLKYSAAVMGPGKLGTKTITTILGTIFTDVTAESGETKDLGDLRIKIGAGEPQADEKMPPAPAAANPPNAAPAPAPAEASTLHGRVLGADGQALLGAKLYWYRSRTSDVAPVSPRLLATTDAAGDFKLVLPATNAEDEQERLAWASREEIVVIAPGHGFVRTSPDELRRQTGGDAGLLGKIAQALAGSTPTVRLPAAGEPIRGRLVNIDGQPVAGAAVKIRWFDSSKPSQAWRAIPVEIDDDKIDWPERVNNLLRVIEPVQLRDVLPQATTDATGRFELRDVGAGRLFQLLVQSEQTESVDVVVRNQAGAAITIPPERNFREKEVILHPRDFVRALGPSQPVTGRVLDLGTGEPIAGAVVRAYAIHGINLHSSRERQEFATRTDAQGRYTITGLPIGANNRLVAFTLDDVPYVPVGREVDTTKTDSSGQDFRLKRGVWATGRVYDAETDKPFVGQISYYWFRNRELEQQIPGLRNALVDELYWTDNNGEFSVPVLPSRGILAFRYSGQARDRDGIDRFPRGAGADAIQGSQPIGSLQSFPTLPHYLMPTNYERVAEINPASGQETVRVDMPLFASQPVHVSVVDADGNPATNCEIHGANERWSWQKVPAAEFSIEDLRPKERRKVFAFHRDRNLAGGIVVSRDDMQPPVIKLASAGSISGRLLDEAGEPIIDATLHADYDKLNTGDKSAIWANDPKLYSNATSIPVDDKGRFQMDGLIPGWTYDGFAVAPRKLNGQLISNFGIGSAFRDVRIEPGEKKDLGDVRIRKADDETEAKKNAEPTPHGEAAHARPRSIRGRVIDEAGQPIMAAHVAAIARRVQPKSGGDFSADGEILAEAKTNQEGRYELTLRDISSQTHRYASLIARHDGFGIAWQRLNLDADRSDAAFTLAVDEPIRGRFIDIEGRPAAFAKFTIRSVMSRVEGGHSENGVGYQGGKYPAAWPAEVNCDQDGRFVIRGIAAGCGTYIDVAASDLFAPQSIALNSGLPIERGERDATYRALARNVKPAEEVVLPLSPAQVFAGTVRYEDTKQPAAHARLTVWSSQQREGGSSTGVEGSTDAEGQYRIHANPGVRFGVIAYPPVGVPYLTRRTTDSIRWETGDRVKQLDLTLPRGVLVRGKVIAGASQAPVAGAEIQYHPEETTNSRAREGILTGWQGIQISDREGQFQIPVLPGPGRLVVHATSGSYVLQEFGSSLLSFSKPGGQRSYAHAIQPIDPPAETDSLDLKIELQPGATISGPIVDQAGQPVEEALVISRLGVWAHSLYWRGGAPPVLGGRFQLTGLAEAVEYPVHFLDAKRRLGATVLIKAGQPEPTVALAPCGSAVVRFLDAEGKPATDYEATIHMVVTPGVHQYDVSAMRAGKLTADADHIGNIDRTNYRQFENFKPDASGKLTLHALIPGATYWILNSRNGRFEIAREFQCQSNETLDLGDITVEASR